MRSNRKHCLLAASVAILCAWLPSSLGHDAHDSHALPPPSSSLAPEPPLLYAEHLIESYLEVLSPGRGSGANAAHGPLSPPQAQVDPHADPEANMLLVIAAFNETFRIILEPDQRFIHSQAVFVEHGAHGGRPRTRPLRAMVYRGIVLRQRYHNLDVGLKSVTVEQNHWPFLGSASREQDSEDVMGDLEEVGKATINFADSSQMIQQQFRIENRLFSTRMPMFRGHFTVDGDTFHIIETDQYRRVKRDEDAHPLPVSPSNEHIGKLIIWRESDRMPKGRFLAERSGDTAERRHCAADHSDVGETLLRAGDAALHRRSIEDYGYDYRRSALYRRASALGCPTKLGESMLYMTAVADCNYVRKHGGSLQARNAIINTFAKVSSIFEANFNIYVGLISVEILPTCTTNETTFNQPCSDSYTITQRLSDFSQWRGTQTSNTSQLSGLFHLMSTCATGSQVGIAWLNTLCQKTSFSQADSTYKQLYVSGTGVSAITAGMTDESKVVAHEMGHNFGSIHDCTTSTCPVKGDSASPSCCTCTTEGGCDCQENFLMNPYDAAKTLNFSTCSKNMVCQKFGTIGRCLEAPGLYETASKYVCGNGIREGAEECDCGGAAACANDPCCNSNCTFKGPATCSPKHDSCCSASCGFATNGTLCRSSRGVCDVAEYCNGTAASCPADGFVADGTTCQTPDTMQAAKCASGQCTSRELYCKARNPTISLVNDTGIQQQLIVGECLQFGKCGCWMNDTPEVMLMTSRH